MEQEKPCIVVKSETGLSLGEHITAARNTPIEVPDKPYPHELREPPMTAGSVGERVMAVRTYRKAKQAAAIRRAAARQGQTGGEAA